MILQESWIFSGLRSDSDLGLFCWILMGYQTVLLIFVKVDDVSEGSWRSFCDPSGLRIISTPTNAICLRFFVLSSDKPSDVSADSCWSRRSFWDFLKTSRTLLLSPGLSRHPERLMTWNVLCWFLIDYQTFVLIFAKVDDVSEWSWRLFRSRLLIPGPSRHWERLATWGFLCWIPTAHQTFVWISVEGNDLSEGSWRCSHDPQGL